MYCSNCGTQIPDDSKFCTGCGAAVNAAPAKTAAPAKAPASAGKKKKEKKKKPTWLTLLVVAAAFLLGKYVIAPAMVSDPEPEQNDYRQEQSYNNDDQQSGGNDAAGTEAYDDIFMSRNIVEMPAMFVMLDSAAFAIVDAEGNIEKLEFGYDGDTVKEMVNTVYYPISDLDEAQRNELDAAVREGFAYCEAEDFCTVTYNMGNLYYTVTLHFKNLDVAGNVQKLAEWGMIADGSAQSLSMAQTESNLLAGGYVKK